MVQIFQTCKTGIKTASYCS